MRVLYNAGHFLDMPGAPPPGRGATPPWPCEGQARSRDSLQVLQHGLGGLRPSPPHEDQAGQPGEGQQIQPRGLSADQRVLSDLRPSRLDFR